MTVTKVDVTKAGVTKGGVTKDGVAKDGVNNVTVTKVGVTKAFASLLVLPALVEVHLVTPSFGNIYFGNTNFGNTNCDISTFGKKKTKKTVGNTNLSHNFSNTSNPPKSYLKIFLSLTIRDFFYHCDQEVTDKKKQFAHAGIRGTPQE